MSKQDSKPFDPDNININKDRILKIAKRIRGFWIKRGIVKNARYIAAIEFFMLGINSFRDDEITAIFKMIFRFSDELRYENFRSGSDIGAETLDKITSKWIENESGFSEAIFK